MQLITCNLMHATNRIVYFIKLHAILSDFEFHVTVAWLKHIPTMQLFRATFLLSLESCGYVVLVTSVRSFYHRFGLTTREQSN